MPAIIRSSSSIRHRPGEFQGSSGPVETALWIALSVMAGVAEETVYRGVFSELVVRLTGSIWLAWSAAVLAFTIAHANQGIR